MILIPNLIVKASSYSAETTFTYTKDGYNYHFVFDSANQVSGLPSGYTFNSSVLNYIIEKVGYGLNVSFAHYNGYFFDFDWDNSLFNDLFSLVQNGIAAIGSVSQDLGNTSAYTYSWKFYLTGVDPNYPYPSSQTYGPAYGFRFTGLTFETFDIVLDQNGNFYGSAPISNYTPMDYTDEIMQWSINQHDSDDIWYVPNNTSGSFGDLKRPYIEGSSLHFFWYRDNVEHEIIVEDFNHAVVAFQSNNGGLTYIFVKWLDGNHTSTNVYIDGVLTASGNAWLNSYTGPHANIIDPYNTASWSYYMPANPYSSNICYPAVYNLQQYYQQFNYSNSSILYAGVLNGSYVNGDGDIWLDRITLTPAPNVPNIEPDVPVPGDDLPSDPTEYEPDPGSEPDPVPGIDYPVPEPDPTPDPGPIPPIVSGNDDLWPDLNEVFDAEAELDTFLNPLQGFEFTSFENLTSFFSSSIIWVSSIMMLLYNGSDFSVLFSVLSIFFIAAALLGIYKWWVSR